MRYNISKATAPAMPNLGKSTECIKLLLSQASKDMHEPPRSDAFPLTWRAFQRRRISVSRPHLEGNVWPNGTTGGRFGV